MGDFDETRDRTFTQALEAQEARERGHSTDANWNAKTGGLPECGWTSSGAPSFLTPKEEAAIDAAFGTVTPPAIEPSFLRVERAQLERILLDLDVARERLAKLLERS